MNEILEALSRPQKTISPRFFYDERGSELFEQICRLPEYYLTRAESEILADRAGEISDIFSQSGGKPGTLIELGSGSSQKTRLILNGIGGRGTYMPIDISPEILERERRRLTREYPELRIVPLCADFTKIDRIFREEPRAPVLFFPGSTIGNFDPGDALALLKKIGRFIRAGGHLIIGVDLVKDREILESAYNDSSGVTAEFNRNVLVHLNREHGADFDLDGFAHRAFFNSRLSRIEMHLVSLREQSVSLGGQIIRFQRGETIHTENSYKYGRETFAALLHRAGFSEVGCWTDANRLFAVFHAALQAREVAVPA